MKAPNVITVMYSIYAMQWVNVMHKLSIAVTVPNVENNISEKKIFDIKLNCRVIIIFIEVITFYLFLKLRRFCLFSVTVK